MSYVCPICATKCRKKQNSIQCTKCSKWVHAPPMKKCSLLDLHQFTLLTDLNNNDPWFCPSCIASNLPSNDVNDSNFFLLQYDILDKASDDLKLYPGESFTQFIDQCENITISSEDNDDSDIFNNINSKYYGIHKFNEIKTDSQSSIGFLHTNLASLSKHYDDLFITLSQLKYEFDVIAITEHKLTESGPTVNIELPGYREFIFDSSLTRNGGTGFYLKKSLAYRMRNDLKLVYPGSGQFGSTFLEIVLPDKKNIVIGCIYRHPSSTISVDQFTNDHIEPLLQKIASENKMCTLMGDFNIDLVKIDSVISSNHFFNTMCSNFFAPYILQPTGPASSTLIDNIFLNTVDFSSYSGNLTIQLSDHLFQFVILEGFFKEMVPKKLNLKERNFKHFNEREFVETINSIPWDEILQLESNDPNVSLENLYSYVGNLLDEFAPYKKVSKKEFKLKSKPWISKEIQYLMWQRDKLFQKYYKETNLERKELLHVKYKSLRNELTKKKRQ